MKLFGLLALSIFGRALAAVARCGSVGLLPSIFMLAAGTAPAQGILGANLIVNGNAEAGLAGTSTTAVASIPGWTSSGQPNVLTYGDPGHILLSDPSPPDHGVQYFVNGPSGLDSTLTQSIDLSSATSTISGGNVKFVASAYIGNTSIYPTAQVTVVFQNAQGQALSSVTLGPISSNTEGGLTLQQQIGLVPVGTTQVMVTVALGTSYGLGAADSLSLVLNTLGTSPSPLLGSNLVVNGNAEAGPGVSPPPPAAAPYIPGWSTAAVPSVAPYGGPGWIQTSDPGPADRGVNLFCGFSEYGDTNVASIMYQDIDVSAAATLIDSGQVTYDISAWLGGLSGYGSPTLVYMFFDWSGKQLAPTGQLGVSNSVTGLFETFSSSALPSGTRRVHIAVSFYDYRQMADDVAFVLAAPTGPPVITPGGIVSAGDFGGFSSVAPGSWIEIYGAYLTASTPLQWSDSNFTKGVAPTQLGGVSVSVGGQAAFIEYISPGQMDALVPSNAPIGPVEITVTNATGTSSSYPIYVNQTEPGLLAPKSLQVSGKQYVAALLSDGQGFALPQNAIAGVASRPANVGETVTIYGVGFGPVSDGTTAGTVATGQNSLTTPLQLLFGTTPAAVSYYGLAPSFTGLYQFDVVIPNVSANTAMPISINLGGVPGSQTLYIAVQ